MAVIVIITFVLGVLVGAGTVIVAGAVEMLRKTRRHGPIQSSERQLVRELLRDVEREDAAFPTLSENTREAINTYLERTR